MIDSILSNQTAGPLHPHHPKQKLTEEQLETIKSILSQYDPDSLTAEDAKAMNDAFRDAGIKAGPGLRNAIESAGFDPDEISRLYPPPDENMPRIVLFDENNSINREALQKTYDILSNYDLADMTEEEGVSLIKQLADEGLLERGSVVDSFA